MSATAQKAWATAFRGKGMSYPAEYVIRIFKGSFPRLDLRKEGYQGKTVCDAGFGDGRHVVFLDSLGFRVAGYDIDRGILEEVRKATDALGVEADLRVGFNRDIPFDDGVFDYLLSWNASYYMGDVQEYADHLREFHRVLRPGGRLVISVPMRTSFIFTGSDSLRHGYRVIRNDPFGIRNGEVMRCFEDEAEFIAELDPFFDGFTTASIRDDCFGFDYHWHLAVCRRRD